MSVLFKTKISNTLIEIVKGDITIEKTDAIVNAANSHLKHGGGVAGAILRAGGKSIQHESDDYIRKNGPVPPGSIVVTNAGNLKAKYIIHAVGPIWHGGNSGEEEILKKALFNVLKKAVELELKSISIPAISSGIFGFPKDRCAEIFAEVTEVFLNEFNCSLELIRYINIDEITSSTFKKVFSNKFPPFEDVK
ncbi:macro domain-containing protein [Thermosipho ferrireducens]|uniref:Macro domain-containing protein n=1 Tax=Thermosipho ferrireducens TaxID=2571116 RepID=A0ABX7S6G8_9BACT|nr:macro domain-containing protein [Thermosipho ferrireducens]QTA37355.1 macro domain-containing protein [Thermosipho ferrireducens]